MTNIKKPVQTPGVAREFAPEVDVEALVADTSSVGAPDTVSPEQAPALAAYIAEQVRKGIQAQMAALAAARTHGSPPAELPDQSEVDPRTITAEVLTKQGYVVPANPPPGLGGRPAHLRDTNLLG